MSGPTCPTLPSGRPIHERLLLFGDSDGGKTRALLSIAKWHQKRGSDAVFYVINNDYSFDRMMIPSGDFGDLENVVVENVVTMQEYIDAAKSFQSKMRSHDWFTVDRLDAAWEAAQDEYAERKWGQDLGSYWATQGPVDSGDDYPIAGWDWGSINKRYRSLANNYVMRMPGHVMCMSGQSPLREASKRGKGGEDKYVGDLFSKIGYKPAGQKEDSKRFHSVIYMGKGLKGWRMQRANDRERDWEVKDVGDFMKSYLISVAGWKP